MSGTAALLSRIHAGDVVAATRVGEALPSLARAVDAIAARLDAGGRWFTSGAGTSGRLAALDAAELPPTFGTPPELVVAHLAGGPGAMFRAFEGAEDDAEAGSRDLDASGLSARDAVLGVSASGSTPYALGALRRAREVGALAVALVCAPGGPMEALAEIAIVLDVGPEVVKGSTRMKAGTAQKMALGMLSTAVMARRGLVYRDEMICVRATNAKLRKRAVRIASDLLGIAPGEAESLLARSGWDLPVALVSHRYGTGPDGARERLSGAGGNVARLLEESERI